MTTLEAGELVHLRDDEFARADAVSEGELIALALASAAVEGGAPAVPYAVAPGDTDLPSWYMPAVTAVTVRRWYRPVIVAIVATLLVLEALGLCSVYGQVVIG